MILSSFESDISVVLIEIVNTLASVQQQKKKKNESILLD